MSFCRWSGKCKDGRKSDAYIYGDVNGKWVCHWTDGETTRVPIENLSEFIKQVEKKQTESGLAVPEYALDDLKEELRMENVN